MANFETIRNARENLVLADLHMAVLFAPYSTPGITSIEDPTTGDISTTVLAPYTSAGIIEKGAGLDLIQNVKTTDIEAYGDADPVRTIINARKVEFRANFLESNIQVLEQYWGTSFANVVPTTTGGVVIEAPALPQNVYYRCILLGMDDVDGVPFYPYYILPRVKLEKPGDQKLKDSGAIEYDMTFAAFRDSNLDFSVAQGWCGAGWLNLVAKAGFTAAPTTLTITGSNGLSISHTPANQVNTVSFGGTPSGGTFALTFNGQTTTALAYNATATVVQSALQSLSTIGAGNVTVTGGPGPTAYVCTFGGTLADTPVANFTTTNNLTGTTPTVTSAITTPGSPQTTQLIATGSNGINYTPIVTWTNPSPTTATVSTTGLATAVAAGTDAITGSLLLDEATSAIVGNATLTVT